MHTRVNEHARTTRSVTEDALGEISHLEVAVVDFVAVEVEHAVDELTPDVTSQRLWEGEGPRPARVHGREQVVEQVAAWGVLRHDRRHPLCEHFVRALKCPVPPAETAQYLLSSGNEARK